MLNMWVRRSFRMNLRRSMPREPGGKCGAPVRHIRLGKKVGGQLCPCRNAECRTNRAASRKAGGKVTDTGCDTVLPAALRCLSFAQSSIRRAACAVGRPVRFFEIRIVFSRLRVMPGQESVEDSLFLFLTQREFPGWIMRVSGRVYRGKRGHECGRVPANGVSH